MGPRAGGVHSLLQALHSTLLLLFVSFFHYVKSFPKRQEFLEFVGIPSGSPNHTHRRSLVFHYELNKSCRADNPLFDN
jgi:hypothetical protein